MLAQETQLINIDLLNPQISNAENKPLSFAFDLARRKLREQTEKNGISVSWIHEASLEIAKIPQPKNRLIYGVVRVGNDFRFAVEATSDCGKTYKAQATIFVAPHDPKIEGRSTRAVIAPA